MLIEQSLLLGQRSVFLGFRNGIKGFVLLDMSTNQIFVSRNVVFYDHILPYKVPSVATDIVTETSTYSPPPLETLDQPANPSS